MISCAGRRRSSCAFSFGETDGVAIVVVEVCKPMTGPAA
jgi:hypothetical protein